VKRLLQFTAVFQLGLCLWLVMRIINTAGVEVPVAPPLGSSASVLQLDAPPSRGKVAPAVAKDIIAANLFDPDRGAVEAAAGGVEGEIEVDEPPLPEPTSIKLSGVMMLGDAPVAILTDAAAGNKARSLRTGDMIGDYEVVDISDNSVSLGGGGDAVFNVGLSVQPGKPGAKAPNAAPQARPVPRPGVRTPPVASQAARAAARAKSESQRAAGVRERVQAAQQRARAQARGGAPQGQVQRGQGAAAAVDPVQARLAALKRLREAAQGGR